MPGVHLSVLGFDGSRLGRRFLVCISRRVSSSICFSSWLCCFTFLELVVYLYASATVKLYQRCVLVFSRSKREGGHSRGA